MTDITDHFAETLERVASAARSAGRQASSVTVIAVSKRQPVAAIEAAYRSGITNVGESYLQEALPKMSALTHLPITWHFLGKVQANKTRQIAEHFAWVHTIDRLRIAERLSEQRSPHAPPLSVFIQVNQAGETQKGGALPEEVPDLARAIVALPRLTLRGLMTLPPRSDTPARWFAELRALQSHLERDGIALDSLSMGMSADFPEAIATGATHVRIGTALFGFR